VSIEKNDLFNRFFGAGLACQCPAIQQLLAELLAQKSAATCDDDSHAVFYDPLDFFWSGDNPTATTAASERCFIRETGFPSL
jgi:hypothetical protein